MKKIVSMFTLVFMLTITSAIAQYECGHPSMYYLGLNQIEDDPEPLNIVREFLISFQERNLEKVASLLDPNVIWVQPGENRISGFKKSKEELLQMFALMSELSATTLKLSEVKFFEATGNTVACLLHWQAAQPIGRVLDSEAVGIFSAEYGKIVAVKIFPNA